jgi:hypothetical protein
MIAPARRALIRLLRGSHYYDWHLFSRVSADDVYLMAYQRSGSTWVRCLLTAYHHDAEVEPALVDETVPDVYRARLGGRPDASSIPHGGVLKSHAPYVRIPARVVYLVRDGRDALMSLHAYERLRAGDESLAGEVDSAEVARFFLERHPFGSWHEHVLGWLEGLRDWPDERYRVLRYEDLVRDPEGELAGLVRFLGRDVDAARVTRAVERTSKDRMAAIEQRAGAGALEFPNLTKRGWRSVLSDEQIRRYQEVAGPALLRCGYALASAPESAPTAAARLEG